MSSECKASTCMANDLWLPSPTAPNIKVNVRSYHDLSDYLILSEWFWIQKKSSQVCPRPSNIIPTSVKSFAAVSWLPRLCTEIPLAFQMSSHKDCSKSLICIIWTEWLFNLSRKDGGQSGKVLSHLNFACNVHMSLLLMYVYIILYH